MHDASRTSASAQFEFSDLLPDGERVVPLERDGAIVWAVRPGEMTPELLADINRYLGLITGSGLWTQQWDGQQYMPPHHRQAS